MLVIMKPNYLEVTLQAWAYTGQRRCALHKPFSLVFQTTNNMEVPAGCCTVVEIKYEIGIPSYSEALLMDMDCVCVGGSEIQSSPN